MADVDFAADPAAFKEATSAATPLAETATSTPDDDTPDADDEADAPLSDFDAMADADAVAVCLEPALEGADCIFVIVLSVMWASH